MGSILALLAAFSAFTVRPAAAHSCSLPVRFEVGQPGAVTVGALAEAQPVTEVDIVIPSGFHLDQALPAVGWTAAATGDTVRYTGGPISPFTCAYFELKGSVAKKGVYLFELATRLDDGSVLHFANRDPSALDAGQLVLAGVEPDNLVDPSTPKKRNWVTGGAAAVAGAGLVFGLRAAVPRLRRRRAARR